MFIYIASIALVVGSNIFYHILQKSTSQKVNPFSALFITYVTAAIITLIAIPFYNEDRRLLSSFRGLNWTSIALGVCIVGLEFGYLMVYRAGWNISVGSLVANIILAVLLIPVGIFFYNEGFEIKKVLGAALCIAGLIIINK